MLQRPIETTGLHGTWLTFLILILCASINNSVKDSNRNPGSFRPTIRRAQKERIGRGIAGPTQTEPCEAPPYKVSPGYGYEKAAFIMERKLIEIRQEWVCSQCGCQFYNPGCVLTGLTLSEIIQHVKKMREQAFAGHVCLSPSEK